LTTERAEAHRAYEEALKAYTRILEAEERASRVQAARDALPDIHEAEQRMNDALLYERNGYF
jgi:hypothetical protein